jgi:hypothetical protein
MARSNAYRQRPGARPAEHKRANLVLVAFRRVGHVAHARHHLAAVSDASPRPDRRADVIEPPL